MASTSSKEASIDAEDGQQQQHQHGGDVDVVPQSASHDRHTGDSSVGVYSQPLTTLEIDGDSNNPSSSALSPSPLEEEGAANDSKDRSDARKSTSTLSSNSSSSSSSADMFTEAVDAGGGGEAPPDLSLNSNIPAPPAASATTYNSSSLDDKLSTISLDANSDHSTAPTSKNTSLTSDAPSSQDYSNKHLEEEEEVEQELTTQAGDNHQHHHSRPFSLQAPETPSSNTTTSHLHKRNQQSNGDSLLKQQLDAYAQTSAKPLATNSSRNDDDDGRWRDSVADGTTASNMDSVALSDVDSRPSSILLSPLMVDQSNSHLANNNLGSFQEVDLPLTNNNSNSDTAANRAEAGPSGHTTTTTTTTNATANKSHLRHSHSTSNGSISSRSKLSNAAGADLDAELNGPSRQSTASSSHNYDLIQQRAESHHAELEEHPRRHRRTLRGSEDLRANFEKLREEMNTPAPSHLPDEPEDNAKESGKDATSTTTTTAAQEAQAIDWDFWGEVMSDYEGVAKTRPKDLSRAIQNGIPSALRGMMWQLMSASKDPELEATYSQLMRLPSTHEKAIIRDLNRTFPTHEYFHDKAGVGQGNLLNIMKAYSLYDDEVGYCQGMAFVVGPLLLNMPDEEAFCVLVRLMKSYDLRSQYVPDMPGLQLRLYQFDRLLEELLPAVFMHLLRQGIKSSMYASQWFLTLLAYRFPLELVCSVFDLIFAEGVEAIFRFALAVMKRNEHKIVEMEFEQVLDFLKMGLFEDYKHQIEEGAEQDEDTPKYSAQTFVKEALQVKITPMMLDQYTSEWTEMCRQQNAQSEEVDQLRAINKKLSNQVRHLEASLSQINQEHCELVKQVVATRLEKEELEDELVRVKMALAQESLLREEGRGSIASRGSYASYNSSAGGRSPEFDRRDSQFSLPK